MIRDARKRKTTHGDKDPNPRKKYNLAPETARVGYKYGKYIWGVTELKWEHKQTGSEYGQDTQDSQQDDDNVLD